MRRVLPLLLLATACSSGTPAPAALDTRNETCAFCRMTVSDVRYAGQLVAPHEEPRFFDDIGCLGRYVSGNRTLPAGALAYVADHRTREWLPAQRALFTRVPRLETPMGSHLIAHADAASRDADPEARTGVPVAASEIFGVAGPPETAP